MSRWFSFRKARGRPGSRKAQAALRLWQVWPLWLIMAAFVVLGIGAVIKSSRSTLAHGDDIVETPLAEGQDLRLEKAALRPGQLYLFSYPATSQRRARFVVQRSADGAVHTLLASCKACYRSSRPHYVSKGQVMCGMCNHPMHRPDEPGLTPLLQRCALEVLPHSEPGGQHLLLSASAVRERVRELEQETAPAK